MTTYGEYQEDTATALVALIGKAELPVEPEAIRNALECRSILLDDARSRLILFGSQRRGLGRYKGSIGLLAQTLDQMPASREHYVPGGLSPLDALSIAPSDPTAHWWREAASNHVLATHQLAASPDRDAWLRDNGSLWHLVGDSAEIVEALTVLDHDLTEAGLLVTGNSPSDVDQARANVSYLAKTARWYTTNPGADFASANSVRELDATGVLLVPGPGDLAPAQRHLANNLAPLRGSHSYEMPFGPCITTDEAIRFIRTQEQLTRRFAKTATQIPGCSTEAAGFHELADSLHDLEPGARLLIDVDPTLPRAHITGQLNELGYRARALDLDNKLQTLSPGEMTDLLHATREACVQGARALRTEATREHSNLRRQDVTKLVGPTRIHHNSELDVRLTNLINVNAQPVGLPPWTPANAVERAKLRATLDSTPTSRPPQHPSPRPRAGRDSYGR
ncbi:hypothetical protein [Nocardioides sp. Root140]|uniref:hypothetical protein n=1 Tax=Nocardioides sp. Root140 TaxID=1736460 RepID=UPI0006F26FB4|nr:hypothetical protein [Nocardioides sp. Root140]KQY61446.1 hypothetical protein ASD30_25650 [Nocardioides sp. Root140]